MATVAEKQVEAAAAAVATAAAATVAQMGQVELTWPSESESMRVLV